MVISMAYVAADPRRTARESDRVCTVARQGGENASSSTNIGHHGGSTVAAVGQDVPGGPHQGRSASMAASPH